MLPEHSLTSTAPTRKVVLWIGALCLLLTFNTLGSSRLIKSSTRLWLEQPPDLASNGEEDASLALPCLEDDATGCRYDEAGAFLRHESTLARGTTGILHPPSPALPARLRRVPRHDPAHNHSAVDDVPTSHDLVDFNPVLYPLYQNQPGAAAGGLVSDLDDRLLDDLTGRSRGLSGADRVRYVQVARSSSHHFCAGEIVTGVRAPLRNWLTVALLDADLAPVVPDAHVAVDLERLYVDGWDPRVLLDFQIFAARTTTTNPKKDQLFVTAAGYSKTHILPIALRRVASPTEDRSGWDTKLKGQVFPPPSASGRNSTGDGEIPASYGSGLQVKLLDIGKQIPLKKTSELKMSRLRFYDGKNLHVFQGTDNRTYLECWPFDPQHVFQELNFFTEGRAIASLEDMPRLYEHEVKPATTPDAAATASFVNTVRRAPTTKRTRTRGTSGFVDVELVGHGPVKVGIAHSVAKDRNGNGTTTRKIINYLSRFYAFLPDPPFPVVAYSGFFCLAGGRPGDAGAADPWVAGLGDPAAATDPPLSLDGETFACPRITFASGFAEYVGHGGKYAIISYGVQDCYSRSIVVSKKRIARLLLGWRKNNNDTGNYGVTPQN